MRRTKAEFLVVLGMFFLASNSAFANNDDMQTERIEDPTKANICVVGDSSTPTNATTDRNTKTVDTASTQVKYETLKRQNDEVLDQSSDIEPYEQLKKANDFSLKAGHKYGGTYDYESGLSKHKSQILRAFDSRCMSSFSTHVAYSLFYDKMNRPAYKIISSTFSTPADEFYCEQAIWEVIPKYSVQGPEFIIKFSGSDEEDSFGDHPELLPLSRIRNDELIWFNKKRSSQQNVDFVTLHVIPAGSRSLPRAALASRHNTVRLSITKLSDPRLTQFRLDSRKILVLPCGANFLVERANAIKAKYAEFFETKEGQDNGLPIPLSSSSSRRETD